MLFKPTFLFIGERVPAEFAEAIADVQSLPNARFAKSVGEALELLAGDDVEPELLVLSRCRPGDCPESQASQLRKAAPLARIVELLGPWFDGELRTGEPLAGTIRVSWHGWAAWFRRAVLEAGADFTPDWMGPVTANNDERLLADVTPLPRGEGLIAVLGSDADSTGWLAQGCRLQGYQTFAWDSSAAAHNGHFLAGIWSAGIRDESTWRSLEEFAQSIAPAPVICLLGFPRPDERQRAILAGAKEVLAQPLRIDDLFGALATVVSC